MLIVKHVQRFKGPLWTKFCTRSTMTELKVRTIEVNINNISVHVTLTKNT